MTLIPVIIESPYAGDVLSNITYARRCMVDSINRREAPFASHLLYPQVGILNDMIESERNQGIECGNTWTGFAHYTAFYTDLGWSPEMLTALWTRCLVGSEPKFRKRTGDMTPIGHIKRPFVLRALNGPVKYPQDLSESMLNFLHHHDGDRFRSPK